MPLMLTLFLALVEHLFIKSLLSQTFNLPCPLCIQDIRIPVLWSDFFKAMRNVSISVAAVSHALISQTDNMGSDKCVKCATVSHGKKQLHHTQVLLADTHAEPSGFSFFPEKEELITKLQRNWIPSSILCFRASAIVVATSEHQHETPRTVIFFVLSKPT